MEKENRLIYMSPEEEAKESGTDAPDLEEKKTDVQAAGKESRDAMKLGDRELVHKTMLFMKKTPVEKDLLFDKMAAEFRDEVMSVPVDSKKEDELISDITSKAEEALAADSALLDSVTLPDFVSKLKYNQVLAETFATEVYCRMMDEFGGLDQKIPDPPKGKVWKFTFSYNKGTHMLDVNTFKDDAPTKVEEGKKKKELTKKQKKEKEEVERLMQDGGIVVAVLSFFGFVPDAGDSSKYPKGVDDPKYKRDMRRSLHGIVSGRNYAGHLICGFLGAGFAEGSVEKLAAKLPPEYGDTIMDLKGQADKLGKGLLDTGSEGTKPVKDFLGSVVRSGHARNGLEEPMQLEANEDILADYQLELTIPAGKTMNLIPVGSGSIMLVDVTDSTPKKALVTRTREFGDPLVVKKYVVTGGSKLGKGTFFDKDVVADVAKAKDYSDVEEA